jgi:formate dehydrogenase (coenzyme F420) beta subunit
MQNQLRQLCRRLLEDDTVQVVIGYGQAISDGPAFPVFIMKPEDADQLVWNNRCFANLTTYLTRKEIKSLGRPAIVVKGCDERALVVLEKESQINRSEIVVIGMACGGVDEHSSRPKGKGPGVRADSPTDNSHPPSKANGIPPKCLSCDAHIPQRADHLITDDNIQTATANHRYADIDEFMKKSPAERLAYWREEFNRCVKCYACRQACPLCYCRRCIVEKNRPQCISTSATLKGNFAYHIARAFHQAGRCIGCDECTRVCPAGINLRVLNLSLAKAAEEKFSYRSGVDPEADPLLGCYSENDKEAFIR